MVRRQRSAGESVIRNPQSTIGYFLMAERLPKILVVEPDPRILQLLVAALVRRFDAHITCTATAEACLDVELAEPHDLVIAELRLEDDHGLVLAERLASLSARPVILLAEEPSCDDALEAMRLGVRAMLRKPFPVAELLEAAAEALRNSEVQRTQAAKYHRVRRLLRQAIRERRDLGRRIDLVCRDLVAAHRRLVHRVLEHEEFQVSRSR